MEPLTPEAREQLKRAHTGLTDADIDLYEGLTSRRFALDPGAAAEEIKRIDGERDALLRRKMPHFANVVNAAREMARRGEERRKAPPRIEILPSDPSDPAR